jgi:hypothetical protein
MSCTPDGQNNLLTKLCRWTLTAEADWEQDGRSAADGISSATMAAESAHAGSAAKPTGRARQSLPTSLRLRFLGFGLHVLAGRALLLLLAALEGLELLQLCLQVHLPLLLLLLLTVDVIVRGLLAVDV